MIYTIIDVTGEIVSELTAADPYYVDGVKQYPEIVTLNVPPGCQFLEGAAPFVGWYDGQWHQRPDRPQPYDSWDVNAKQWVDARILQDVKTQQWASVSAARDATIYGTFIWDGSTFQVDDVSQQKIQGGVMLAQLAQSVGNTGWTINWTLADNSVRVLSIADMVNVGLAVGTFFQTNWNKATALRDQIMSAQTAAAVMAIVWS